MLCGWGGHTEGHSCNGELDRLAWLRGRIMLMIDMVMIHDRKMVRRHDVKHVIVRTRKEGMSVMRDDHSMEW